MDQLMKRAQAVRDNAYAPYSQYQVGAAVRDVTGRVYVGVNVENVSYGATMCAERAAVMAMVAAGSREFTEIAISTRDGGAPCGLCLQVLFEFASDPSAVRVGTAADEAAIEIHQLVDLMPHAFQSKNVARTERTTS